LKYLILIFILFIAFLPLVKGDVETRFMRSDRWDGYYKLLTTQTTTSSYILKTLSGASKYWYLGVRIYIDTKELTSGVYYIGYWYNNYGIKYRFWTCPSIDLPAGSRIYVKVYYRWGGGPWYLMRTFASEIWPKDSYLISRSWKICLYGKHSYNYWLQLNYGYFYHGVTTYNSRIEGLEWAEKKVTFQYDVDLNFGVSILTETKITDIFTIILSFPVIPQFILDVAISVEIPVPILFITLIFITAIIFRIIKNQA